VKRSTKKRIIRLGISLPVYVIYEVLDLLRRLIGIPSPARVVSIYYHQVTPAQRERFARQMDHLRRWAQPASVDELDALPVRGRTVIVTADDGWLSFVENALPELEQRSIPVTIFVVSHRLGETLDDPADRIMTESELLNLRRDLVTIGSHTSTHARLTTLSETDIRRELLDSRARLSQLLKTDVTLFCFPFGALNAQSLALCHAAGYARAFGTQSLAAAELAGTYLIERVRVDPTDWPIEFHLKIMGAYRSLLYAASIRKRGGTMISWVYLRLKRRRPHRHRFLAQRANYD
jgi:peptidoglycan/xylan/chitin deacetylase (PgdA/CDA1 family)